MPAIRWSISMTSNSASRTPSRACVPSGKGTQSIPAITRALRRKERIDGSSSRARMRGGRGEASGCDSAGHPPTRAGPDRRRSASGPLCWRWPLPRPWLWPKPQPWPKLSPLLRPWLLHWSAWHDGRLRWLPVSPRAGRSPSFARSSEARSQSCCQPRAAPVRTRDGRCARPLCRMRRTNRARFPRPVAWS